MKHIAIRKFGGPEVLEPAERDAPVPGAGQVLIKVHAAGVNRPDVFQRQGIYPPPPGASDIPGLEVAGEVTAVGAAVTLPKRGDQVCAIITGGGYAEYAVADAAVCLPVPKGLTPAEAAAIPETFFTVWSNVFDRAALKPGETFLVHGGTSGIGTTAIQLARAFGARVFATAGSDEKCSACVKLGAERAFNYHTQDFVAECEAATDGQGVNVILDMVAGDYIQRNLHAAAEDGRIVIIAGLRGFNAEVNFLPLMRKRITLSGSTLRNRSVQFKAAIARSLKQYAWPLLETGTVRPVIYTTLKLDQAAEAHRLMEAGEHIGKIVLIAQ
ncbi:MAG: NAD(P)H-quinone oxidoreductase [Gammaproteobacteria bacterium]|nr:NAD(P)H-quinone oxidoreductase [Gammaproteobacteria bacterium]